MYLVVKMVDWKVVYLVGRLAEMKVVATAAWMVAMLVALQVRSQSKIKTVQREVE